MKIEKLFVTALYFLFLSVCTHQWVLPALWVGEELGVWQGVEGRQSYIVILHTVQHLAQGRQQGLSLLLRSTLILEMEMQSVQFYSFIHKIYFLPKFHMCQLVSWMRVSRKNLNKHKNVPSFKLLMYCEVMSDLWCDSGVFKNGQDWVIHTGLSVHLHGFHVTSTQEQLQGIQTHKYIMSHPCALSFNSHWSHLILPPAILKYVLLIHLFN